MLPLADVDRGGNGPPAQSWGHCVGWRHRATVRGAWVSSVRTATLEQRAGAWPWQGAAAVVADDLTGAMDGGVQLLAQTAVEVLVSHGGGDRATTRGFAEATDIAVLPVINTQSRGLAPDVAAARVSAVCRELSAAGRTVWFKKLDSTLRGNVGAELAAMHKALAPCVIVCTPALPAEGRTVQGGVLRVAGEPVMATPYCDEIPAGSAAADSSAVIDIVRRQWPGCRAVQMPAPTGAAWQAALRARPDLIAVDAASDADLEALVAAAGSVEPAGRRLVWAGSAGLLRALTQSGRSQAPRDAVPRPAPERSPTAVGAVPPPSDAHSRAEATAVRRHTAPPARPLASAPPPDPDVGPPAAGERRSGTGVRAPAIAVRPSDAGERRPDAAAAASALGSAGSSDAGASRQARAPIVVVAGSRRALARRQVDNAAAASPSCLTVRLTAVPGGTVQEPRWRLVADGHVAPPELSGTVAVAQAAVALDRRQDLFLCAPAPQEASTSLSAAHAEAVAEALAGVAASALEAAAERPLALLLVGGDTAYACLQRLAIDRLTLAGEAEPYVPWARVRGGPWHGMAVITKAGGFGDPLTLNRICAQLRIALNRDWP